MQGFYTGAGYSLLYIYTSIVPALRAGIIHNIYIYMYIMSSCYYSPLKALHTSTRVLYPWPSTQPQVFITQPPTLTAVQREAIEDVVTY